MWSSSKALSAIGRLYSPVMLFPATTPTAGCRVCTAPSDWLAALVHLDSAVCVCYFFLFSLFPPSPFAYSSEGSWILMTWLQAQWVPVAAGHCGKLAPSLIVIHRPSSVPIKIRKDDTYGGTCSSKDICMMSCVCVCGSRCGSDECVRTQARVCVHAYMHIQGRGNHWVAMVTSTTRAQETEATGSQWANQRSNTHHAVLLPINVFRSLKRRGQFPTLVLHTSPNTLQFHPGDVEEEGC